MVTKIAPSVEQQAPANGHLAYPASGDGPEATAVTGAARDHVWVHTLTWNEYEGGGLHVFDIT